MKIIPSIAMGLCLVAPFAMAADEAQAARFSGGHVGGFHAAGHGFYSGGARFGGLRGGRFGGFHIGHFGSAHFAHFGSAYSRVTSGQARIGSLGYEARAFAGHNAFGGRQAWNAWHRGGYGWGWASPVFWPYFYGDLLSFALWPDAFYDPFFGFGPDDLLASIFWSGAYPYGWSENPYDIYAYAGAPGRHGQAQADRACAALAPGITDLPLGRIERAIKPNDTQAAILDDLKTASAKAADILSNSCPSQPPLTPVSRLDAAGKRIDAMLQAVQILRAPLTTFVNSLDDPQRKRFNAIAFGARSHKRAAPANALGGLCSEQAKDFANLPISDIETTVKPAGEQQTAVFTALKNASAEAASGMQSSCPTTTPATLTDRFDLITKRLDAMAGAVKTIEPPLKTFYASLNDDQKARFNILAPPGQAQAQSK